MFKRHLSLVCLVAVAGAAQSAMIGMNFVSAWPTPRIQGESSNGFSNWTDSVSQPDDGWTVPNSDDSRAVTLFEGGLGAKVEWNCANMWDNGAENDSDQQLFRVYLDDGDTPSTVNALGVDSDGIGVAVRVTGLATWLAASGASSYRVYAYVASDAAEGFQPVDLRQGGALTGIVLERLSTLAAYGDGDYPTSGGIPTGYETRRGYYLSSPLSVDTFTLTIPARNGGTRGTLAGLAIVTEDSPVGIHGTVELQDFGGDITLQPVQLELYAAGGVLADAGQVSLATNGEYLWNVAVPDGEYTVYAKAKHWLRRAVGSVQVVNNSASGVDFSLFNGDVDGDNVVTVYDYNALSEAFDKAEGDAGWNADADLDGDGAVTVYDYNILSANFDLGGD